MHHSTQETLSIDRFTHWTAYAYTLHVGMMHALLAPTQKDRASDGGKEGGTKAGTEIEGKVSVSQDYFY